MTRKFKTARLVLLAATIGVALAAASAGQAAIGAGVNVQESITVTGNLTAGGIANINLTLTNIGSEDFVPTAPSTRPAAAFAEIVIPTGLKRQVPASNTATDNPLIICEAYRGTHGGLTQSAYSDICRVWFYGPIAAGAAVTAVIPAKSSGAGDFTTWAGAALFDPFPTWGVALNNGFWLPKTFHIDPQPPKVVTGGATAPDLQAGVKASTGSPAAGSDFWVLFTARNSSKIDALGATFTAVVPEGLTVTFATFEYGDCSVAGNTVSCWSLRPITSSLAQSVQIFLTAPTTPGSFSVAGTFADTNGDSSLANNTATVGISIK